MQWSPISEKQSNRISLTSSPSSQSSSDQQMMRTLPFPKGKNALFTAKFSASLLRVRLTTAAEPILHRPAADWAVGCSGTAAGPRILLTGTHLTALVLPGARIAMQAYISFFHLCTSQREEARSRCASTWKAS